MARGSLVTQARLGERALVIIFNIKTLYKNVIRRCDPKHTITSLLNR